jgi:hypothetical protein
VCKYAFVGVLVLVQVRDLAYAQSHCSHTPYGHLVLHVFRLLLDLLASHRLSDGQKDVEILLLRHQLRILQRKLPNSLPPRVSRLDKGILALFAVHRCFQVSESVVPRRAVMCRPGCIRIHVDNSRARLCRPRLPRQHIPQTREQDHAHQQSEPIAPCRLHCRILLSPRYRQRAGGDNHILAYPAAVPFVVKVHSLVFSTSANSHAQTRSCHHHRSHHRTPAGWVLRQFHLTLTFLHRRVQYGQSPRRRGR